MALPVAMAQQGVRDRLDRPMRDLRISVTDRCNFRCVYCMPKATFGKDFAFLPQQSLLRFEEIERIARAGAALGVRKIRLTGGEPLLRKNIEQLIEKLAAIRTPDGRSLELAMTTNGALLRRKARSLADAGLNRVTVSLDALDDAIFRGMNDVDFPVADVLDGIDAAREAGLAPLKINMVVKRGVNEDQILPMARYFHGSGAILRFIEYMDVGETNGWQRDHTLPSRNIIDTVGAALPLIPVGRHHASEPAERWRYVDGGGEIGVISSVTHAFCGDCTRARLSTEGALYHCLFATRGYDLRALVRDPSVDDAQLTAVLAGLWQGRDDRYSELRGRQPADPAAPKGNARRIEMSYIGG
ncbi:GTP 3',8-cyclase MoaA [Robbsia sp. KACC 23696]|uniref:GTP 3',8-cyclase MoaA n=1 Tax=Robbsia sp. KACC 23696 TaxID=3149231 RepID=UPI00325A7C83